MRPGYSPAESALQASERTNDRVTTQMYVVNIHVVVGALRVLCVYSLSAKDNLL